VSTVHEQEWATWCQWSEIIVKAAKGVKGVRPVIEHGDPNRQGPTAVFYFEEGWNGPSSKETRACLAGMDPEIHVGVGN
jgi:hypothetical protein